MTGNLRSKITLIVGGLIGVNVALWITVLLAAHRFPFLIATGLLAFGFGLRHAVDADHISAIDNTTRKLMQEGKRPVGVGFFFSLGHSTIVLLLCAGLAVSTTYISRHMQGWHALGNVVGSIVSGSFLYLIGAINLVVLIDLAKAARGLSRGECVPDTQIDAMLQQRGLLGRLFRPLLKMVQRSRHMFLIGMLFGLGFDTATEVGILAVSARSAQLAVPFWAVMLLPLLFTAGMCLIDTLDSIFMLGAYGWSTIKPSTKLYYNVAITALSVALALAVGSIELLQTAAQTLPVAGRFWSFIDTINIADLGYAIVATFAATWAVAAVLARVTRGRAGGELLAE